MKTLMITILAGLVISSCSKNNREANELITGQWEHRKDEGGFVPLIQYPPGNGNIQVFGSNKEFKVMRAGAVAYSGNYELRESGVTGKWLLKLNYTLNGQQQSGTDTVIIANNQLIHLPDSPCCDMPTRFYERLGEQP